MLNDAAMQATIGRNAAVAEIGPPRITLTGFIAFIAWLGGACFATYYPSSQGCRLL
jgi:hypothetical protein